MGDRFLLWLGAGAVCAGVTAGMLAGAGTAFAQTESGDDGGAAKTSQSTKAAETKPDSGQGDAKPAFDRDAVGAVHVVKSVKAAVHDAVTKPVKAVDGNDRETVSESNVATAPRPKPGQHAAAFVNDVVNNIAAAVTHVPDRKVVIEKTRQPDPVEPDVAIETTLRETLATPIRSNLTLAAPTTAQPKTAAAAAPRPQIDVPPVVSAIGTAVFGLISLAESVIEGPPMALPGSGVRVERSTLDLGGGHVVPADWYFPEGYDADPAAPPPERIIYLQHGFLARGVFYDYTASYLAKQTNSVVVAPTLTSNIFATDGMWLGGDQMHRAVADLFEDANPALLDSAQAAGYKQDQLPQQVVLIGHSLGGGLVIDTARYMKENETSGKLAGVVMLDGVSFTDPVPILKDLEGIPVYNLSATPYPWNLFGTMDAALAQVRPDDFTGAQLLFGLHSDAMIGGNPLVQFGAYLLTGFSLPGNAAGSQVLAAGWIDDLFDGDRASGFYGEPGKAIRIPTPVGPAFGLVQPRQGLVASVAQEVTGAFFGLLAHINFATDVPATEETGVLGVKLHNDTALSLDGKAPTGQSVGQHV
jgi:acetyl esterase/lipase